MITICLLLMGQLSDAENIFEVGVESTTTLDSVAFDLLRDHFREVQGLEIVEVERKHTVSHRGNGSQSTRLFLRGLASSASQLDTVREQATGFVNEQSVRDELGVDGTDKLKVDVSRIDVVPGGPSTPMLRVLSIERLMNRALSEIPHPGPPFASTESRGRVAIQAYDERDGVVVLTGVARNASEWLRVMSIAKNADDIETVLLGDAIVMDALPLYEGEDRYSDRGLHDSLIALKWTDGRAILEATDFLLRQGKTSATTWHLRAAGHLLTGDDHGAAGCMRVSGDVLARYPAFEFFQGIDRVSYERMVAAEPFIVLAQEGVEQREPVEPNFLELDEIRRQLEGNRHLFGGKLPEVLGPRRGMSEATVVERHCFRKIQRLPEFKNLNLGARHVRYVVTLRDIKGRCYVGVALEVDRWTRFVITDYSFPNPFGESITCPCPLEIR